VFVQDKWDRKTLPGRPTAYITLLHTCNSSKTRQWGWRTQLAKKVELSFLISSSLSL